MMVILGEKLRCISDKLHWFEVNNIYEVVAINGSGSDMKISFKNCEIEIHSCQLDSFERIPAVQKYTFDDLIDVAVQAYKDGVLSAVDIESEEITIYGKNFQSSICDDSANEGIKHIQSLYKETFVIECNGDMYKLKIGDIFSQNGARVVIDKPLLDILMNTPLFLTKGAKVEQSKC